MTLGQRLRQARIAAGLSQRQLCGAAITRNQLSQLECDRAVPSLGTLSYLAGRLGKPVSYFLGESASPNLPVLEEVCAQWERPRQALLALEAYRPEGSVLDDLASLLEARLRLTLAREEAAEGASGGAQALLEQALAANGRSRLEDASIPAAASVLRGELNPSEDLSQVAAPVLTALAKQRLALGKPEEALTLLEAGQVDNPSLHGEVLCALGRYAQALELLIQAEARTGSTRALLLQMETCCRELGDYKGAYDLAMRIRSEFDPR